MKLEINYKKKVEKITNMWRLNTILLNNYWVQWRNQRRNKKIPEEWKWKRNENENMAYQNLWDAAKVLLRGIL